MEQIKIKRPFTLEFVIFIICAVFHYVEVLIIRTDETFLADNFINKVIGIAILLLVLRLLNYSLVSTGFRKDKLRYLLFGFAMGLFCFALSYGLEFSILSIQKQSPFLEYYVSGFSLTGEIVKQTGLLVFFLCMLFNIINVIMEEGIFRGLFVRLGMEKYGFTKANWFAAFLFGTWHLSLPVRSVIDGQMRIVEAAGMGIGYVIISMIMGIKWGLWLRNTGCLWFGVAEHFFNNTIGNLIHVVSNDGHDELQIVRIIFAQMLSLIITLVINRKMKQNNSGSLKIK
jgi:membrane protease YdiL (CAAX protease family)